MWSWYYPCIMHILIFPQKFGQKSAHKTWQNMDASHMDMNSGMGIDCEKEGAEGRGKLGTTVIA